MKVLAVGGGGREHAAVEALYRSGAEIYSVMKNANPGIITRSKKHLLVSEKDVDAVCAFAKENGVELITAAEMKIINDKRSKEKK